jgi:hypothetical protein
MGEGKRSRRARVSAVATAVAITAPILFLGAALARAAESTSEEPTSVSVSYTDGSGQPEAPSGSTTSTTDTLASNAKDVGVSVNGAAGDTGTTGKTGTNNDSVEQIIAVPINPGPLTVTPSSESVSFAGADGSNGGRMAGSLSTVTVVDARGSLVGWDATVSLQSVDGVSAADLAKAKLCVSPDAVTVVAGNPPEVKAGRHACAKAGDALTLIYAPSNGGGGTFSDTGGLTLQVPGAKLASPVTATLAVAVH